MGQCDSNIDCDCRVPRGIEVITECLELMASRSYRPKIADCFQSGELRTSSALSFIEGGKETIRPHGHTQIETRYIETRQKNYKVLSNYEASTEKADEASGGK